MSEINVAVILSHPLRPSTFSVAERVANSLEAKGLQTYTFTQWIQEDVISSIKEADMVVAIGGDGAMLRAARACAPYNVPVLGINMGQLGFLTEIPSPAEWDNVIDEILAQNFWIETRMMIKAQIMQDNAIKATSHALNDVVMSGNAIGKMVQLETYIDGDWTTTYHADALIVATATGSTAYALATGGPILPPELKNILIVPSAPHLSMERPIVLAEGAQVEIRSTVTNPTNTYVTIDGNVMGRMESGDRVMLFASEYVSRFIRTRGKNYFYRSLLDRLEPRIRRPGLEHGES